MKFNCALILIVLTFCVITGFSQDAEIVVLGIAQDAGYPQANCEKQCCLPAHAGVETKKHVASIGIIDAETNDFWIIDCTPDFKEQLRMVSKYSGDNGKLPSGIFLTHAHIGHYLGLVELGREVINSSNVPVHAMPRMKMFIENNAPWEQLVKLNNIKLQALANNRKVKLSKNISITPMLVPHRDEYSETVGFLIETTSESLLYIPDIDKWEKWDKDINELIKTVDYALLDGSFYKDGEIPGRNMNEIPHPFVIESLEKFSSLSPKEKAKIHFTHFNHTNPLLNRKSTPYRSVFLNGYNVATEGLSFYLN